MTRNLTTLDVSRDGIFIVDDRPAPRGQLVHVSVLLPSERTPLPLRGMVLHVVSGEEAAERQVPAGMGIQFYGLGRAVHERWERFFEQARSAHLASGAVVHPPTPATKRPDGRAAPPDGEATADWARAELAAETDELPTARRGSRPAPAAGADGRAGRGGALVATGGAEAPVPSSPSHFRLCPSDVAAMHAFRRDALESGGVVLVGAGPRPPGSPAVVSVVHPVTGAEFHVPGEVEPGDGRQQGTIVRFLGLTTRTMREFEHFAEAGTKPAAGLGGPPSAQPELSIFWSPEDVPWDLVVDPEGTVVVERTLPLEAAVNPFLRR